MTVAGRKRKLDYEVAPFAGAHAPAGLDEEAARLLEAQGLLERPLEPVEEEPHPAQERLHRAPPKAAGRDAAPASLAPEDEDEAHLPRPARAMRSVGPTRQADPPVKAAPPPPPPVPNTVGTRREPAVPPGAATLPPPPRATDPLPEPRGRATVKRGRGLGSGKGRTPKDDEGRVQRTMRFTAKTDRKLRELADELGLDLNSAAGVAIAVAWKRLCQGND